MTAAYSPAHVTAAHSSGHEFRRALTMTRTKVRHLSRCLTRAKCWSVPSYRVLIAADAPLPGS